MKLAPRLEDFRIITGSYASPPNVPYGAFKLPGPCGERLTIIASDGTDTGWEHVSVSTERRIPNWTEMAFIKDLFWDQEDCVVQFHPPRSQHINNYSKCLHLWRYLGGSFPQPPAWTVGIPELGTLA